MGRTTKPRVFPLRPRSRGLLPGTLCSRGRTPVAVETERRPGGSCGPEALHLTFEGLEP